MNGRRAERELGMAPRGDNPVFRSPVALSAAHACRKEIVRYLLQEAEYRE